MSFKSGCQTDLKETKLLFWGGWLVENEAHFALGQFCLGRAPLWLQRFTDSWGVFRHMWRAACDQCHFNFSLVIMWWRARLNDASLVEGIHWSTLLAPVDIDEWDTCTNTVHTILLFELAMTDCRSPSYFSDPLSCSVDTVLTLNRAGAPFWLCFDSVDMTCSDRLLERWTTSCILCSCPIF